LTAQIGNVQNQVINNQERDALLAKLQVEVDQLKKEKQQLNADYSSKITELRKPIIRKLYYLLFFI